MNSECSERSYDIEKVLFSIITVCLNPGESLDKTVDSVLLQSYTNWELIIKDGLSDDKSTERIQDYSRIRVIKKKDNGIYQAMNQALEFVKGDYVIFLNAGDVLANERTLENMNRLISNSYSDIYYGDYINFDGNFCKQPSAITKFFLYRSFICHQTIIYNSNLKIKYNESYKLLADHDLHLRLLIDEFKFNKINEPIVLYEGGGVSEQKSNRSLWKNEKKSIINTYYNDGEKVLYCILMHISLPYMRRLFYNKRTPRVIKKLYRSIANKIRK